MVVPPRATVRVLGTDTIEGGEVTGFCPSAGGGGAPSNLVGSRPSARFTSRIATFLVPRGGNQADRGRTDKSFLIGQGFASLGKGEGVGTKGIFQTAGLIGVVGNDVGRVSGQKDQGGGWLTGTVGHKPGIGTNGR